MKKITIDSEVLEQVIGALVRAEVMHGQPNFQLQEKLREALEQNIESEPSPVFVLLAVEEAVKNGNCPFQIEEAFNEYEMQRTKALKISSVET